MLCGVADIFTKPLPKMPFARCRSFIMTIAGKIIEYIAKVPRSRAIDTSNTNAVVQFLADIGFLQNNDLTNA